MVQSWSDSDKAAENNPSTYWHGIGSSTTAAATGGGSGADYYHPPTTSSDATTGGSASGSFDYTQYMNPKSSSGGSSSFDYSKYIPGSSSNTNALPSEQPTTATAHEYTSSISPQSSSELKIQDATTIP